MTWELPGVQTGIRKGRGTRDQSANIRWIMEKTREFQKNTCYFFIDYAKAFDCICWCVQSWPTLCDPMDYSSPGSSVHGLLQARILEWVAIFFSKVLLSHLKKNPTLLAWTGHVNLPVGEDLPLRDAGLGESSRHPCLLTHPFFVQQVM